MSSLSAQELRALQFQIEAFNNEPIQVPDGNSLKYPQAAPLKKVSNGKLPPSLVACEFCQKRKIRCGGGSPCVHCSKRGIECVYPTPAKRGPKPKKSASASSNRSSEPSEAMETIPTTSMALTPVTQMAFEELLQKYNSLKVELQVESRLTEHWRQQYFMAQNAANAIQFAQREAPQYSERTASLLTDPGTLVDKFIEVFLTSNQYRHPSYTWRQPMAKSIELFHEMTNIHADTLRSSLRRCDISILAIYFEHVAVFLFSSSMLTMWDLTEQFQQIALDLFQMLFFEREAQSDETVAQQLLYSLVIMSDYFKFNGRKGTQQSIRLITAQILERFEKTLEDSEFVIGIYVSCLTGATSEPARQYWISKIVNCINANGIRLRNNFLYTFAYVFSGLKSSNGTVEMLQHYMYKLEQAEAELESFVQETKKYQDQTELVHDHVAFYGSWIHILKAEIFHRLSKRAESLQWIQRTCLTFNVIRSDALRAQLRGLVKFCTTMEKDIPAQINVFYTLANWLGISQAIEAPVASPAPLGPQIDNFYSGIISREAQMTANIPTTFIAEQITSPSSSDSLDSSATSPVPVSTDELMEQQEENVDDDGSKNPLFGTIFGGGSSMMSLGDSIEIPQFSSIMDETAIDDLFLQMQTQQYALTRSTAQVMLGSSCI